MGIKVKFMSYLKEITGTSLVELQPSFDTVEKIMDELLRLYPQLKDEMFYEDGTMDFIYQLILNGKRLSWPENKNLRVKNGDQLMIMVFIAGG
ncbi:MAG TPA: MoaD family protein [Firmicutes bacterium]|nr:MoaD family protein [Bacillota bacterium]